MRDTDDIQILVVLLHPRMLLYIRIRGVFCREIKLLFEYLPHGVALYLHQNTIRTSSIPQLY